MKTALLALASVVALSACNGPAPSPAPAASAAGAGKTAAPAAAAVNPPALVVVDGVIAELDPKILAGADWTAKGCSLTAKGDAVEIQATPGVASTFEGYVIDPANAPAGDFLFLLKGEKQFGIPVKTGWLRPDVAEFFKTPGLANAGFLFSTTLGGVPAGRYEVNFMMDRGAVKYFCESGKTLVVR